MNDGVRDEALWSHGTTWGLVWLRDHRRVAADSVAYVSLRLGTSILVWLLVGIALALPAGLYLAQRNLNEMGATWEGRPGFSVYLEVGSASPQVAAIAQAISRLGRCCGDRDDHGRGSAG